jgi:hypothetical protein
VRWQHEGSGRDHLDEIREIDQPSFLRIGIARRYGSGRSKDPLFIPSVFRDFPRHPGGGYFVGSEE